ncbi:uncharacterized protein LOC111632285 [Centruroides sculpturatus]|uniref:uncharacterized protein LOC111632285 n=1 Tax=Centruroides sculpturatus TaxID=218467 RepID=UPI000C6E0511|nr:uncharacterized protein LOC111632285 [Centruroides sculpturatus]
MFPSMSPEHSARDPRQRGKIPNGVRKPKRQERSTLDEAYLAYLAAHASQSSEAGNCRPQPVNSQARPTPCCSATPNTDTPVPTRQEPCSSPDEATSDTSTPPSERRPRRSSCRPAEVYEAYPASQGSCPGAATDEHQHSAFTHTQLTDVQSSETTRTSSAPAHSHTPSAIQSTESDSSPPLIRRPRRRIKRSVRHRTPTAICTTPSQSSTPTSNIIASTSNIHPPMPTIADTEVYNNAPDPPPSTSTTSSNHQPYSCTATIPPASQPSTSPPAWVMAWRTRFDCALDEDMLEDMVHDLVDLAPQRHIQTTNRQRRRHPPPNHRTNNRPRRYSAAEASRLQRLYRLNKRKAFEEVTHGNERFCQIDNIALTNHFSKVYSQGVQTAPLTNLLPSPLVPATDDPLTGTFTPDEVASRLARCHNTTPGPDGVRYHTWRRLDPQGHILAALFNAVQCIGVVPTSWKTSTTILIHKKGDRNENDTISTAQKGFVRFDGCSEHTFTLQSVIQDARRKNKECHVAWLDLANAFGSVPHATIISCLKWCGLAAPSIQVIEDLLHGCHTRIRSSSGLTDPIPILAGVKQGCPLSPILFNLVVEPVLRMLSGLQTGYSIHGRSISVLAYADDITITSPTVSGLQQQLNLLTSWAIHSGLTFNPAKCATLSITGKYYCTDHRFKIQETDITILQKHDHYMHLGVPTGFTIGKSATAVVEGILNDLKLVDNSCLAPWQKIDSINTFLTSRLVFHLTLGNVSKKALNNLDKNIKRYVKRWMNLPQRASPEVVHMPNAQGGVNVSPCTILADVAQVSHAVNLFLSRDHDVTSLATNTLKKVVEKRLRRVPSDTDLCTYLAGSMEGEFGCDPYDIPSLWTRLRMATRRLRTRINIEWHPNDVGTLTPSVHGKLLNKTNTASSITNAIKSTFLTALLHKPDQGKAFRLTAGNPNSNHFLWDGNFVSFADWRFVHQARLSVVPLRGHCRFGNASQNCFRCQRHRETLAHVINHCPPNFSLITKRHNAILNRLLNAFDCKHATVYTNQRVPGYTGNCRPDIVIINQSPKTATIVDVATPFENGEDAFNNARKEKVQKYADLAAYFRDQGFDTFIDAFVVGALGGYDAANEGVIQRLGISRRYAKLMRFLMVSDCIKWSKDIYMQHLLGRRQP